MQKNKFNLFFLEGKLKLFLDHGVENENILYASHSLDPTAAIVLGFSPLRSGAQSETDMGEGVIYHWPFHKNVYWKVFFYFKCVFSVIFPFYQLLQGGGQLLNPQEQSRRVSPLHRPWVRSNYAVEIANS